MINVCPQCKAPIPREVSRFCNQCGAELQSVYASLGEFYGEPVSTTPEKAVAPNSASLGQFPQRRIMAVPKDDFEIPRPQAMLRIILRDGGVVERELTQNEMTIGKGSQNDIILPDASVSGAHALIRFEDGVYKIIDIGSRNGTAVNEARLGQDARAIQHGDLIRIGRCALTFKLKDTEAIMASRPQRTLIIGDDGAPIPPPAPPGPKPAALTEDALARAVISSGLATQSDIESLRGINSRGRRLYYALIEDRYASETELRDLMSRVFNIHPVELDTMDVDAQVAGLLKAQFLRERLVCPVVTMPEHLTIVVADPTDKSTIEEIEAITRKKVSLRLSTPGEIFSNIDKFFRPRLVGVMTTGEKIIATLNQSETEIGKAPHNKIILTDPTVSASHAIIMAREEAYNIIDLGSSNGTFVNGQRLGNVSQVLRNGDKIHFGQAMLTFYDPAEQIESKTARLSPEALEEIRRRAISFTPQPAVQSAIPADQMVVWKASPVATINADYYDREEKSEEPKKRKKKKKDDRLKAAMITGFSRILAQALGVLLTVGLTIYVLQREPNGSKHVKPDYSRFKKSKDKRKSDDDDAIEKNDDNNKDDNEDKGDKGPELNASVPSPLAVVNDWTKFDNGFFGSRLEASGVAYAPGLNGVVFVTDNRGGEAEWMQLDENGQQIGDIKKIPLGVDIADVGAITYGDSYFYMIASQADPNAGAGNAIIRFKINPQTQALQGRPEVISGLRSFLLKNISEIASAGAPPGEKGGLKIEGLAWDPINERLLLGLRSPIIDGKAVIIPISLLEPHRPFKVENLKLDNPKVTLISLGGQGMRDITYDQNLKDFLIISGELETSSKTESEIWRWSGQGADPIKLMDLDKDRKPDGITNVTINGRSFAFIVGGSGRYLRLDYK